MFCLGGCVCVFPSLSNYRVLRKEVLNLDSMLNEGLEEEANATGAELKDREQAP